MEKNVWRKSTRSYANSQCVEVALTDDAVLVRHSKGPEHRLLSFTHDEWVAFIDGAKNGEFDL